VLVVCFLLEADQERQQRQYPTQATELKFSVTALLSSGEEG